MLFVLTKALIIFPFSRVKGHLINKNNELWDLENKVKEKKGRQGSCCLITWGFVMLNTVSKCKDFTFSVFPLKKY